MMRITYLSHSGFLVELKESYLLFDYYKGRLPKFDTDKPLYVFVSHVHYDHYKKSIFKLREGCPDIYYILSDDIDAGSIYDGEKERLFYMRPNEEITVGACTVRTLGSTDEGVAFVVGCEGNVVYHAGDLNWWHWAEESEVFNTMMRRKYQGEIQKLKRQHIDVAFVPVDPRLSEQYYWGLDYFMKQTDTAMVFPMHFWGDYSVYDMLMKEEAVSGYAHKVCHIEAEGQVFEVQEGHR